MSSVINPRPMAKAATQTVARVRLARAFQFCIELSAPRASAAVTTHASGSKNIPSRCAQGLGILLGNKWSTKASKHPRRRIAMLNRTGARNISCSVIRSHRIANGFSTSLGSNVAFIEHRAARLGRLSAWLDLERTNCASKDLQSTSGKFGEGIPSVQMSANGPIAALEFSDAANHVNCATRQRSRSAAA